MSAIDRRQLLKAGVGLGLGLATSPLGVLGQLGAGRAEASTGSRPSPAGRGGYGPLTPAGPVLALPEGFRYVRFGDEGSPMVGGAPTPPLHDGMAAFSGPSGTVRLVRNHECGEIGRSFAGRAYDRVATGGTTTLVFDTVRGRLLATYPTLAGTFRNCAGGRTPWGSWLSCEEGTSGPRAGFGRLHGYVFEVSAQATGPVDPVPLRAMGRFVHEAVAVDPATGIVYLTEDRDTAGFYRFIPAVPGKLAAGGRLEMLAVPHRAGYDTRTGQTPGEVLAATWVPIHDPDPDDAGLNPFAVFRQGFTAGGAIFGRLEGCCFDRGRVLINATSAGDAGCGQIWEYHPQPDGHGRLRLLLESPSPSVLRRPDNVTVSPRGGVLVSEDRDGVDRLIGIGPEGRTFEFARNRLSKGEFAGVTFGPAGKWLFVNIQQPGMTLAITGPWERGCL